MIFYHVQDRFHELIGIHLAWKQLSRVYETHRGADVELRSERAMHPVLSTRSCIVFDATTTQCRIRTIFRVQKLAPPSDGIK